jgi:hypothetical protein
MPKLKFTLSSQKEQLDKICANFIQKENAFYHPDTKNLSFIIGGQCIKGECTIRDSDKLNKGFFERKILVPLQICDHFKTTKSGVRDLPIAKIGKVVICLSHFFFEHQIFYLRNGELPEKTRLTTSGDNFRKENDATITYTPNFPWKFNNNPDKEWRGHKVNHSLGLSNTDWVN